MQFNYNLFNIYVLNLIKISIFLYLQTKRKILNSNKISTVKSSIIKPFSVYLFSRSKIHWGVVTIGHFRRSHKRFNSHSTLTSVPKKVCFSINSFWSSSSEWAAVEFTFETFSSTIKLFWRETVRFKLWLDLKTMYWIEVFWKNFRVFNGVI